MRRRSLVLWVVPAALIATLVAATAWALPAGDRQAGVGRPLLTAIDDSPPGDSAGDAAFGRHVRAAGAKYLRVGVRWGLIAPAGSYKPTKFDPRDPGDRMYDWSGIDHRVRVAVRHGLSPILSVYTAPEWAQSGTKQRSSDGPIRPSPAAVADFATAVATRYSGRHGGLPRVRHYQVWNEPNLSIYLGPQSEAGKQVSPSWYRSMVNSMARAVHRVHRDNVVIAGGLAPFGGNINDRSDNGVHDQERIRPLEFMRKMLCMSAGVKPTASCNEKTEFDVWAHHPYTYGGPTHGALHPDDVSLGDLPQMRRLLDAAVAAGHVVTKRKVGFWVTEFSYDTSPPDPKGLPPALHARWVSEALYRMWDSGVSVVTWFLLRDQSFPQEMFQSGLYYSGPSGVASDRPKPALQAFRFPFVAFRQPNGEVSFWGRTPASAKRAVVVEQLQARRWRRLAEPEVDEYGIFSGRVATVRGATSLRARLVDRSDSSVPFDLKVVKDFRFCPWGSFC